ncbi:MAG TPA: tetratricopeptide repeat protein, partial [Pyrinomonadaceae bacterium]|nr:tetratricopeptide repeat protein [Pyrinomonadaceae bacterium]
MSNIDFRVFRKSLRVLLPLVLCLAWPGVWIQAQEQTKALTDEADARLTSVAARKAAVTNFLTAADQLRNAGDGLNAARAWNRAGRIQLQLTQANEAIATYRTALRILRNTSDSQTLVDSLNGLANVYKHLSKCDTATPLFQRAISLSRRAGYVEGAADSLMISSYCQNDTSLALQNAQDSLRLWQSTSNKLGVARAYQAVGEFQMIQN